MTLQTQTSPAQVPATRAPRPAWTPIPATCEHTDRPAWPVSEAGHCHACHDLEFRTAAFVIGAKASGFDVTPDAASAMLVKLNTLALAVPAMTVRAVAL